MTIIDTTLYANGALRLSRHGAGRGGNVLTLVATGESLELTDTDAEHFDDLVKRYAAAIGMPLDGGIDAGPLFRATRRVRESA